jgi:hypothetical protein
LTTTPLTRYRLSYDCAPEIVMAPPGPLALTPGDRSTEFSRSRGMGSLLTKSLVYVVEAVVPMEIVSCDPATVTSSATPAWGMVALSSWVCAAESFTVVSSVWKPCSSNLSLYSPGGRNLKM